MSKPDSFLPRRAWFNGSFGSSLIFNIPSKVKIFCTITLMFIIIATLFSNSLSAQGTTCESYWEMVQTKYDHVAKFMNEAKIISSASSSLTGDVEIFTGSVKLLNDVNNIPNGCIRDEGRVILTFSVKAMLAQYSSLTKRCKYASPLLGQLDDDWLKLSDDTKKTVDRNYKDAKEQFDSSCEEMKAFNGDINQDPAKNSKKKKQNQKSQSKPASSTATSKILTADEQLKEGLNNWIQISNSIDSEIHKVEVQIADLDVEIKNIQHAKGIIIAKLADGKYEIQFTQGHFATSKGGSLVYESVPIGSHAILTTTTSEFTSKGRFGMVVRFTGKTEVNTVNGFTEQWNTYMETTDDRERLKNEKSIKEKQLVGTYKYLKQEAPLRIKSYQDCINGDMVSCRNVGLSLINIQGHSLLNSGESGIKNEKSAMGIFKKACEGSDYESCYRLGDLLINGSPSLRNEGEAHKYLQIACDGKHHYACFIIGLNICVPSDDIEASKKLSLLAESYEYGHGVPVDNVRAFSLYTQACDGGDVHGCYSLAVMYDQGRGVESDKEHALNLYQHACSCGVDNACNQLPANRRKN